MGLDMYLEKRTYVGNNYKKLEEQAVIKVQGVKQERVNAVVEEVGYWRKSNAIHHWFVMNIQNGENDCGTYFVHKEQLKSLLLACKEVLEKTKVKKGLITSGYKYTKKGLVPIREMGEYISNPEIAHELLPTTEGFFSDGTEYDQYYLQDIHYTIGLLNKILQEDGDFYYHSSW